MKSIRYKTAIVFLLLFPIKCFALHEGDFFLEIDQCNQIQLHEKLKPSDLEPEYGFWTKDPGFDSEPGTFSNGSAIGFNVLQPLMKWDDANEIFYSLDHTSEETMIISFLSSLWVQTTDSEINGFEIDVASNGSYHKHYNFTLVSPDSNDPCDGIYLLEMELYSTSETLEKTDPFIILFNNGEDETVHTRAFEWAQDNLIYFADIDDSNAVDFADFARLAQNWNLTDCNCVNDWCSGADIGEDGYVDVNDVLELSGDWLDEVIID